MPSGKSGHGGGGDKGTPMTPSDASRIQGGQARSGGDMSSGGFAARAQSAGDTNQNTGYQSYGHSQGQGGGGQGKK
ncbi:translation initiation factor SUI1 [Apiospora arundinis]